MWIFAKGGFLSIVKDRNRPGHLLVRARVKGDIEYFFPEAKIERTEKRDYLYRASIDQSVVARAIHYAAMSIDYDNFKDNIADSQRKPHYLDVWTTMAIMQDYLNKEGP